MLIGHQNLKKKKKNFLLSKSKLSKLSSVCYSDKLSSIFLH